MKQAFVIAALIGSVLFSEQAFGQTWSYSSPQYDPQALQEARRQRELQQMQERLEQLEREQRRLEREAQWQRMLEAQEQQRREHESFGSMSRKGARTISP